MSVLLLFLDGVGCGARTPGNPALHTPERVFASFAEGPIRDDPMPFDGVPLRVDAHMGISGRPQSGTGHTAILTGRNAPRLLGMHLWALPNKRLRGVLEQDGIFGRLNRQGYRTRFLNAYRPPFFDWGEQVWDHRSWRMYLSATSWANRYAGNPYYDLADLRARRTVAHDYSNRGFADAGFDVPVLSMEEAGAITARGAERNDFSMHEHFLTDLIGHKGDPADARNALRQAEAFLLAVLQNLDLSRTGVIVVSDHGNIEEPQHGRHTDNPAIGMLFGTAARHADSLRSLTDVVPAILDLLGASDNSENKERASKTLTKPKGTE